ncbi:MAG: hypothetical protein OEW52_04580 [Thermoleophilia bacterium]|nr:hypothetical protein [Thermoleophilia bacterium]MDH5280411.1 hypothetical protein [Thermoleophilia bacterium]
MVRALATAAGCPALGARRQAVGGRVRLGCASVALQRPLSGYVARETGDLETACEQLSRAAAYFRGQIDNSTTEVTPEWEAWVTQIEIDATSP